MLTITILILSIATSTAISQHLWNPTNGFLNITSLPLSYSKTRNASLKVVKWAAHVGLYYLLNNEMQTICLHKELFLTANKTSDKSCIWRIECKRRGRIIYKRLFVENESNLSCKKFYLGQGCSSNYDDSLFLLQSEPQPQLYEDTIFAEFVFILVFLSIFCVVCYYIYEKKQTEKQALRLLAQSQNFSLIEPT